MKRSVRDILFTVACAYFAYEMIGAALKVPFSEWVLSIWISTIMGVVLAVFGVIYGVRAARDLKEERAADAAEEARLQHEKKTNLYTMDTEQSGAENEPAAGKDSDGDIDECAKEAFSEQPDESTEKDGTDTDDSL